MAYKIGLKRMIKMGIKLVVNKVKVNPRTVANFTAPVTRPLLPDPHFAVDVYVGK